MLQGFYAVAVGPPTSIVCSERQSTWQLWHPGLEAVLDSHCSSQSTVGRIARAVNAQVDCLRDGLVIQVAMDHHHEQLIKLESLASYVLDIKNIALFMMGSFKAASYLISRYLVSKVEQRYSLF